jgi:hypothetical protein
MKNGHVTGLSRMVRALLEAWRDADFTGQMFFEARFAASLRIADKPLVAAASTRTGFERQERN